MDIEFIKILLEIREYTLKYRKYVEFTAPYSMTIWDFGDKSWTLPSGYIDTLEHHFPYDKNFVDWLNHQLKNSEFEKEIQRYLDLKAFI